MTLPNDGSVLWGPRRDQNGDFRRMLLGGGGVECTPPRSPARPEEAGKVAAASRKGTWLRAVTRTVPSSPLLVCRVPCLAKFSDFRTMMEY